METVSEVSALCEYRGRIWVGTTDHGLFAVDLASLQVRRFSADRGDLTANGVLALAADPRQGCMWIGTAGGGVVKYDGQTFQCIRLGDAALENVVAAVRRDRRGPAVVRHRRRARRLPSRPNPARPGDPGGGGRTPPAVPPVRLLHRGNRRGPDRVSGYRFPDRGGADALQPPPRRPPPGRGMERVRPGRRGGLRPPDSRPVSLRGASPGPGRPGVGGGRPRSAGRRGRRHPPAAVGPEHDKQEPGHGEGPGTGREGCRHQDDGHDPGGNRGRQGPAGRADSRTEPAPAAALRPRQLRRHTPWPGPKANCSATRRGPSPTP